MLERALVTGRNPALAEALCASGAAFVAPELAAGLSPGRDWLIGVALLTLVDGVGRPAVPLVVPLVADLGAVGLVVLALGRTAEATEDLPDVTGRRGAAGLEAGVVEAAFAGDARLGAADLDGDDATDRRLAGAVPIEEATDEAIEERDTSEGRDPGREGGRMVLLSGLLERPMLGMPLRDSLLGSLRSEEEAAGAPDAVVRTCGVDGGPRSVVPRGETSLEKSPSRLPADCSCSIVYGSTVSSPSASSSSTSYSSSGRTSI
jgi:hypothetical protein